MSLIQRLIMIIQPSFFESIENELGTPLGDKGELFIKVVEATNLESFIERVPYKKIGCPKSSRLKLLISFVMKHVWNYGTTRQLIDTLLTSDFKRRLCGWHSQSDVPSEATFSRAYKEFTDQKIAERIHAALVIDACANKQLEHNSIDSTEEVGREKVEKPKEDKDISSNTKKDNINIEGTENIDNVSNNEDNSVDSDNTNVIDNSQQSEASDSDQVPLNAEEQPSSDSQPTPGPKIPSQPDSSKTKNPKAKTLRRRGRPRKGEVREEKPLKKIEIQPHRTLEENLEDLPKQCDYGTKMDSNGHKHSWPGYKLHLSVVDGQIPVAAILTSASVHDSQVAIPLMQMTKDRVQYNYDLMDAAYDAESIKNFSRNQGHTPIIDPNNRGRKNPIKLDENQKEIFKNRTTIERVNSDLKDNHGGRTIRVRGAAKVMTHLMFGVIVVTVKGIINHLLT